MSSGLTARFNNKRGKVEAKPPVQVQVPPSTLTLTLTSKGAVAKPATAPSNPALAPAPMDPSISIYQCAPPRNLGAWGKGVDTIRKAAEAVPTPTAGVGTGRKTKQIAIVDNAPWLDGENSDLDCSFSDSDEDN